MIVGASLTGLTLALACAGQGISTTVVERVQGRHQGGGALGIDKDLLLGTIGPALVAAGATKAFPTLTKHRKAASWQAVHDWLREQASRSAIIKLIPGKNVLAVRQGSTSATAIIATGDHIEAGIIIGADGYRSVVRRAVDHQRPFASYAGYLLWRGLVAEEELPCGLRLPNGNDGAALVTEAGYRLIAYPVAGPNNSLDQGKRSISFAWYDPFHDSLLRKIGCLSPCGQVTGSLSAKNIPSAIIGDLCTLAGRLWPDPWRSVICHALERREVFGTPIAEYLPRHLHYGRLAVTGDAAHVVSPVTGQGFVAGILDAQALARCLGRALDEPVPDLPTALESYSGVRLAAAQALAVASARWTRTYLLEIQNALGTRACKKPQKNS